MARDPKPYSQEAFKIAYPGMFDNVYCGFGLPEGWGPILWKTCKSIMYYVGRNPGAKCTVAQVKEKFGTLRFYCDTEGFPEGSQDHESVRDLIRMVEHMSHYVCQDCGTTDDVTQQNEGWVNVRCGTCRAQDNGKGMVPVPLKQEAVVRPTGDPADDDILGDDPYPSEWELARIAQWSYKDIPGLFAYIKPRWRYADSGFWSETNGEWRLATGGWSGNEDIIGAMQSNFTLWSLCWQSSERGGKYVFNMPGTGD